MNLQLIYLLSPIVGLIAFLAVCGAGYTIGKTLEVLFNRVTAVLARVTGFSKDDVPIMLFTILMCTAMGALIIGRITGDLK